MRWQNVCKPVITNQNDVINGSIDYMIVVVMKILSKSMITNLCDEINVCKPLTNTYIYENDVINGFENVNRLYDCSYEINFVNVYENTKRWCECGYEKCINDTKNVNDDHRA